MVVDSRNTAGEAIASARRRFVTDSERALQDHLDEMLNRRGFETTREMVVVPRDRVDIAVYPNADLELLKLIEVKTADPIRGVGQVLSYKAGAGQLTHCGLVVDWTARTSQVVRACYVADIELWDMRSGEFYYVTGPPILYNTFRAPDEPALEYEPFVPSPVRTCPCCDGVGKARPEAIEKFEAMVAEGLLPDNLVKKGNGAGLVTGDL